MATIRLGRDCIDNTIINKKGIEKVDDRFAGYAGGVDSKGNFREGLIHKFNNNKHVRLMTEKQKTDYWELLVDTATGGELDRTGIPSVKQQQVLKKLMDVELGKLGKDINPFNYYAFLPPYLLKKMPQIKKVADNFVKAEEQYKGNEGAINASKLSMYDYLRKAGYEYGVTETLPQQAMTKLTGKSKITRDLEKKFTEFNRILVEKGRTEAQTYYLKDIGEWVNKGEGRVFREFNELLLMPLKTKKNENGEIEQQGFRDIMEQKSGHERYNPNVIEAAGIFRLEIQPHISKVMSQGLGTYIKVLETQAKSIEKYNTQTDTGNGKSKVENAISDAKELGRQLESKDFQNNGLYPVLALDILPKISEAFPKLLNAKNQEQFNEGYSIIRQLNKILSDNKALQSRMAKNVNSKNRDVESEMFNYNLIPMIDSFSKSANVFNYTIYNTSQHIKALDILSKTIMKNAQNKNNPDRYIENLDEIANGMKNYLNNIYDIQMGEAAKNSEWQHNFVRALTAYQFFSKLGFNLRSAARNATQSILNYVEFGWTGIAEINKSLATNELLASRVERNLVNNGIRYANLGEVPGNLKQRVELDNVNGGYRLKLDNTLGEQLTDGIVRAADASGIFMHKVENGLNRRWTYTLGFVKHWNMQKQRKAKYREEFVHGKQNEGGTTFLKIAKEKGWGGITKDQKIRDIPEWQRNEAMNEAMNIKHSVEKNEFNNVFNNWREVKADRFASEMVRKLHFDYSQIGKAPWMVTPVGSVVGQFSHYGQNFFVRNKEYLEHGARDVVNGNWDGVNAWRMYRLGLVYGSINAIISPLMGQDVGNLIQHDTLDRLEKGMTLLTSDDEQERLEATYGDGIFSVLGPTASSIHDVIMLVNLYDKLGLPEDTVKMLLGYEEDPMMENDRGRYILRNLNLQADRLWNQTGPKILSGQGLGAGIDSELGLYRSKEVEAARKRLGLDVVQPLPTYDFGKAKFEAIGGAPKVQDNAMIDYLRKLEAQERRGIKPLTVEQERVRKLNRSFT